MSHRPLREIASEISSEWKTPHYSAAPYLAAMHTLTDRNSTYFQDSATSVILYFLSNASTWRGPVARRIKAELNAILSN